MSHKSGKRPDDSRIVSEQRLRTLAKEWQQRLRLKDWNISVRLTKDKKFQKARRFGQNACTIGLKESFIEVLHAECIGSDWVGCHDTEATLVHELLHLHGNLFLKKLGDGIEGDMLEAMIEMIALALVAAKRGRMKL